VDFREFAVDEVAKAWRNLDLVTGKFYAHRMAVRTALFADSKWESSVLRGTWQSFGAPA
jgi:hypothetical protein